MVPTVLQLQSPCETVVGTYSTLHLFYCPIKTTMLDIVQKVTETRTGDWLHINDISVPFDLPERWEAARPRRYGIEIPHAVYNARQWVKGRMACEGDNPRSEQIHHPSGFREALLLLTEATALFNIRLDKRNKSPQPS